MFQVTKTYGHERGLSAAFRQWKANSHCNRIHGYALAITLTFEADALDDRNWVIDFGALKPIREFLEKTFDHKLLVAGDDPYLDELCFLQSQGLADVVVLEGGVGCERFAEYIADWVADWLAACGHAPRVRLVSVEVREHGANAATNLIGVPQHEYVVEQKIEKIEFNIPDRIKK